MKLTEQQVVWAFILGLPLGIAGGHWLWAVGGVAFYLAIAFVANRLLY